MTEKILLPFYSAVSLVIYIVLLGGILAIPVLFASQAYVSLDFDLEDIAVSPASSEDASFSQFLSQNNYRSDGWYRIDYRMNVGTPKLSPYRYTVRGFALKAPVDFKKTGAYFLSLDAPLAFSRAERDDFTLSLYVYGFEDEAAVNEFARTAGFGTRGIVRTFSVFSEELNVNVPGFYVAELI